VVTKSDIEIVSSPTLSQIMEIGYVTEPLYQNGTIEFNRLAVTWNFKHHAVRFESQNLFFTTITVTRIACAV